MKSKSTRELIYIGITGVVIAFVLLMSELYYTNYLLLSSLGWNSDVLDVSIFQKSASQIFDDEIEIRTIILGLLALLLLYPSTGEKPYKLKRELVYLTIIISAFYASIIFHYLPYPNYIGQVLNICVSLTTAFMLMRCFFRLSRFLSSTNVSLSQNDEYSDGFAQTTTLIETPISVNLTYKFSHRLKNNTGYINVINPYRASYVIGTPGSGKSYAVLEEYLRQLIFKGFSAIVYDYKDPVLSNLSYNYLMQHKDMVSPDTVTPEFCYLSFKHINKTYRCNPIKDICTAAEALDVANVMLVALNKNFASKQGEFFVESAGKFTALNIYALGMLYDGKYQSLPHVISMLCRKASQAFPALKVMSIFYPDMKNLFSPFEDAFDNDVVQQLQGQLASAQIGLGSMSDASLAFVMTEDPDNPNMNVDLNVNSLTKPKILCIGNDPEKDKVLGLAASVYLSRLAKKVNKKGTPCLFAVDELPTVFINGIDNLIATARSNKVAVLLGFQDFSQLIRDYSDKIANSIINTIGNIFVGAVKGETAKRISDSFGEKKVLKKSKSINEAGDINTTHSEQKEKRIAVDKIEELSQGEFVGRVSDEFTERIEHKVFYGSITVDPKYKEQPLLIPDIREWGQTQTMRELQLNFININNEVSEVLAVLKSISSDYIKLKAITFNDDQNANTVTLQNFIEHKDEQSALFCLLIWLELAYYIIYSLEQLNLKNDVLRFDEKFELLLRDVYTEGMDGINAVKEAIIQHQLYDLSAVQQRVHAIEQEKVNTETNYNDFE